MENYSSLLHHKCHASLAYHNSKFKKTLVFVIDRNGSIFFKDGQSVARESESVFVANKNKLECISKNFWLELNKESQKYNILNSSKQYYPDCDISSNNSLGITRVYEAATTLIGQHVLENGKTMGLASYGKKLNNEKLFVNNIPDSNKFSFLKDDSVCFYNCENSITKDINKTNYNFYADKARLVQTETQEQSLRLIKKYVKSTGIKNVCMVGGYALNVVANNFYLKNLPNVNFYFEPVADDTGVPIGAAMLKYKEETKKLVHPCTDNFYHYYKKEKLKIGKKSNIKEISKLLADKLGNKILNGQMMFIYQAQLSFKIWHNVLPKIKIPGVVHVDNTCRVQTVSEGFLYKLLKQFYVDTKCPVLLNTSFNLAGEALVQTQEDALLTLKNSSLDAIYFVDEEKIVMKDD